MNELLKAARFTRNDRFLHALIHQSQAWLSATDLGRLMGYALDERRLRKLDTDQYRFMRLDHHGDVRDTLMVSESGMYALMVYHNIPENRNLRKWLTHDVILALRSSAHSTVGSGPELSTLQWAGHSVSLLHWNNQAWVQWRDMPVLMPNHKVAMP